MKPFLISFFVVIVFILPGGVIGATYYVDDDAPNDPGPGDPSVSDPLEDGSVDHPYDTIREGINAAADGVDNVLVKDGTYTGTGNKNLPFDGKSITVASENGAENCIIDCEGYKSGFYFHAGEDTTSVVDGFTITNGFADMMPSGGGGGIRCEFSSPTITNCTISGNISPLDGGGISCRGSSPTISNCTISNNWAIFRYGGGIYCYDNSSPTITNCTISGNIADENGGGIYCYLESSPTITNCTISNNWAINDDGDGGKGGGIYCEESSPTITNCTISDNIALGSSKGGGISCYDYGNPTITNCTISDNRAYYAGGISCWNNSSPTITNCAINDNSASQAGGIYCESSSSPTINNCTISGNSGRQGGGLFGGFDCQPTMTDCILWGNTAFWGHEIALISTGYPAILTVRYSDVQGGAGEAYIDGGILDLDGTNIDEDPLFVSGPLGDFYLSQTAAGQPENSPCVDAGSDTAANLGLDTRTTRSDSVADAGMVDMGYHCPIYTVPMITWIERVGDDVTITWDALPTISYVVEWSEDLSFWHEINVGQAAEWVDYGGGYFPQKYYRVREE